MSWKDKPGDAARNRTGELREGSDFGASGFDLAALASQ
jgi:hypothetical protein